MVIIWAGTKEAASAVLEEKNATLQKIKVTGRAGLQQQSRPIPRAQKFSPSVSLLPLYLNPRSRLAAATAKRKKTKNSPCGFWVACFWAHKYIHTLRARCSVVLEVQERFTGCSCPLKWKVPYKPRSFKTYFCIFFSHNVKKELHFFRSPSFSRNLVFPWKIISGKEGF